MAPKELYLLLLCRLRDIYLLLVGMPWLSKVTIHFYAHLRLSENDCKIKGLVDYKNGIK